ncbi:ATP-binding protein [Candidatus Poriferisocius sp.]|uniref:BbrUII/HgiDII family restriction enzyme n=1 Tax=Candidatus Poriferisocius sp. TaxID=3101276 RepID=UPI003B59C39A
MTEENAYEMTVGLSVLESLGINLYSNAAAVLSELVANAYDADATLVDINWWQESAREEERGTVTIIDDGCGMTKKELNERFLAVGYQKRAVEGGISSIWNRPFMGRKGIGKLSIFSVAEKVTVYSTKDGESNGFTIDVRELQAMIKEGKPYHPIEAEVPDDCRKQGTIILLDELKHKRADITANALRKRIARRFDIFDGTPREKGGFKININGEEVTWKDRKELENLEFIWEFGRETIPAEELKDDVVRLGPLENRVKEDEDWFVSGWIGTAQTPSDLTKDREAGSLKNIIILARRRPIQEGIIDKLDFSRIFGNYVTGQIQADFLDLDDKEDIATSDRQRLIEDDPRVVALQEFLRGAFLIAADQWTNLRPERKAKDALDDFPRLRVWVEGRRDWQKEAALKMIGTISALPMEEKNERVNRAELLRSGVLAFERIALRETSEQLEKLSRVEADDLLQLLGAQDDYEVALWGDILHSRIEAIKQFENLTESDQKERVLQEHLFEHLWLLDPSWERATGSERMEESLHKIDPEYFPRDRDGKKIQGRLDLRYATTAGVHIIAELKKYSTQSRIDELVAQGQRYYAALQNVLERKGLKEQGINVIFVLGKKPRVTNRGKFASDDEAIAHALEPVSGRYVLYDELIENAVNQYEEYFNASEKVRVLDELLNSLV